MCMSVCVCVCACCVCVCVCACMYVHVATRFRAGAQTRGTPLPTCTHEPTLMASEVEDRSRQPLAARLHKPFLPKLGNLQMLLSPSHSLPTTPLSHCALSCQIFNFDIISIMPLECVFPYNFLSALIVRTLVPLVLVAVLLMAGRHARRRGAEAWGYLLTNGGVVLVFLCYPSITQVVFKFFQVKQFDGDYGSFLVADYSIDANGSAYKAMAPFATTMIFVWPIGVPVIIAVLLWRSRPVLLEIRRREKVLGGACYDGLAWEAHVAERRRLGEFDSADDSSLEVEGYLWSLTESYRGSVFYFEVLEYVLQKLTLGVPLVITP